MFSKFSLQRFFDQNSGEGINLQQEAKIISVHPKCDKKYGDIIIYFFLKFL